MKRWETGPLLSSLQSHRGQETNPYRCRSPSPKEGLVHVGKGWSAIDEGSSVSSDLLLRCRGQAFQPSIIVLVWRSSVPTPLLLRGGPSMRNDPLSRDTGHRFKARVGCPRPHQRRLDAWSWRTNQRDISLMCWMNWTSQFESLLWETPKHAFGRRQTISRI